MNVLSKEAILSIEKMRKNGMKNGEIAKALKTSTPTVIRWVKRLRESGREIPKRVGRQKVDLSINKE